MRNLSKARDEIDNIDTQIIKLFEQRMDIVKDVANYKIENNLPVLDSSRENIMLEKNLKKLRFLKENVKFLIGALFTIFYLL